MLLDVSKDCKLLDGQVSPITRKKEAEYRIDDVLTVYSAIIVTPHVEPPRLEPEF